MVRLPTKIKIINTIFILLIKRLDREMNNNDNNLNQNGLHIEWALFHMKRFHATMTNPYDVVHHFNILQIFDKIFILATRTESVGR